MISGVRQARVWVLARLAATLNFRVTLYKHSCLKGVRGQRWKYFAGCQAITILLFPFGDCTALSHCPGDCARQVSATGPSVYPHPVPERGNSCCSSHHLSGLDHLICGPGNRQPSERRQGLGISQRDVRTPMGWPKGHLQCHWDGLPPRRRETPHPDRQQAVGLRMLLFPPAFLGALRFN